MKAIEKVLGCLQGVQQKSETQWMALCPAHDDHNPSLSIGAKPGKVVMQCMSRGCDHTAILRAIGLEQKDLFDDGPAAPVAAAKPAKKPRRYRTADEAIDALAWAGRFVAKWPYQAADGSLVGYVIRLQPAAGEKTYRPVSRNDDGWAAVDPAGKWPLYRLRDIGEAGTVYVCEGEKAADAAASIGLAAVASAHGAKSPHKTEWAPLSGRTVAILPDNDQAGADYAKAVSEILLALQPPATVRVVTLPGLPPKGDIADLVQAADDDDAKLELRHTVESLTATAAPAAKSAALTTERAAPEIASAASFTRGIETLNDQGLSRRFVVDAKGELRFLADQGIWLTWTGAHWKRDQAGIGPQRAASAVADNMWRELVDMAAVHGPGGVPTAFYTFAKSASSRKAADAMIELAKSKPGIPVSSGELDADPYLLNCTNGTLDLRTVELRPHSQADMLTAIARVAFNPAAQCPKWLRFIDEVTCGDRDLAAFLQRSFGVALSGDVSCQAIWIHYGQGANGKTTAIEVIADILGDYAGPVAAEALLSNPRGQDRERALTIGTLVGKRLAIAAEPDSGMRLSEGVVKSLTGAERVQARFLHRNPFEVTPTWHPHFATNHKPEIRGTDHAIWRRVMLVPWNATFTGDKQNPRLREELREEAEGILRWLVAGFASWQAGGLRPPESVAAATREYREENDRIGAWIADRCEIEPAAHAAAAALYADYRRWCEDNGEHPQSNTAFGREMTRRGHVVSKLRSGHMRDKKVRTGIRLAEREPCHAGWDQFGTSSTGFPESSP